MNSAVLRSTIDLIKNAGVDNFILHCNNGFLVEIKSESTRVLFDDVNELMWFFRIPNNVQHKNPKPIAIECLEYEYIERISVPTDYATATSIAKSAGLQLTEELTKWLKTASSQVGIYPVQNEVRLNPDGTVTTERPYNGIPRIK